MKSTLRTLIAKEKALKPSLPTLRSINAQYKPYRVIKPLVRWLCLSALVMTAGCHKDPGERPSAIPLISPLASTPVPVIPSTDTVSGSTVFNNSNPYQNTQTAEQNFFNYYGSH